MIDSQGNLRCDGTRRNGQPCRTILGSELDGRVRIVCWRSDCHRNNIFNTDKSRHYSLQREIINKQYKSHKLESLTTNE